MPVAALTFDAERHEYRVDGVIVPGVTHILRAMKKSTDFEEIALLSRQIGRDIRRKRDLGSTLHADAWAYDDNDIDLRTVDEEVRPYLDAWATFRANSGLVPLSRERAVYHPVLRYCGTLDGVFRSPRGRTVLVDLKIGNPADAACHLQTAGYQLAYEAEHGPGLIDERWAVRLCPGERVPYKVTPYGDWRDFAEWQACVTDFHLGERP